MRFFKQIDNGYLIAIGEGDGETEIAESEYRSVMQKIQEKPAAPEGFRYRLRADTLEWELAALPEPAPEPEEVSSEEIAAAIEEAMR